MVVTRAHEDGAEVAIKCDVAEQANQFVEQERNAAGEQPYAGCQKRNHYQAELRSRLRLLLRRDINAGDRELGLGVCCRRAGYVRGRGIAIWHLDFILFLFSKCAASYSPAERGATLLSAPVRG